MLMMQRQLTKFLEQADKLDELGYYKEADKLINKLIKNAQLDNMNPDLLKFLIESTDKNKILQVLEENGFVRWYDRSRGFDGNIAKFLHPDANLNNPELSTALFQKMKNVFEAREKIEDLSPLAKGYFETVSAAKGATGTGAAAEGATGTAAGGGTGLAAEGVTGTAAGGGTGLVPYEGGTGLVPTGGGTGLVPYEGGAGLVPYEGGTGVAAKGATGTGAAAGTAAEGAAGATAAGTAGTAAEGAAGATAAGTAAEGAAGAAAAGKAGTAGTAAEASGIFAKLSANPAFKTALDLFQKAAPAMKWLPPVAVAIELAAKAMSGKQLDGYDVAKLAGGMALIPPVAAAIAAIPVVGGTFLALAATAAFGGADVWRFMSDPRKGLDLFGMNLAEDQKNYDDIIDKAIQNAKSADTLNRYIKTANKKTIEKHIVLSYLLQRKAINDYLNTAIKKASSNRTFFSSKIFKTAQAQESSLQQYLEPYMKIDTSNLASIASSIELNVKAVSDLMNKVSIGQDKAAESAAFEAWVDSQIRGATAYKDNAGIAFNVFGLGEVRKNEVQKIANSLNMISSIRKQFLQKQGASQNQQPNQQPNQQYGQNYFEKAGIDSNSYTGTAEQNEKLRKAIDPSARDFDTAFRKKFNESPGMWNSPERLNALNQPAL